MSPLIAGFSLSAILSIIMISKSALAGPLADQDQVEAIAGGDDIGTLAYSNREKVTDFGSFCRPN